MGKVTELWLTVLLADASGRVIAGTEGPAECCAVHGLSSTTTNTTMSPAMRSDVMRERPLTSS
jgi:hypothetical protein